MIETKTNDAKELAAQVVAFLDLQVEVSKSRDSSGGLARVRSAESDLRKLCRLYASDERPTGTLFDGGDHS